MSASSSVFLVAVAMMNMAEQADHQVAASEARATALGAPPLTAASLAAEGAAAASTSVSAGAARTVNRKADEIRDRHDKAVHVVLDPPDGASAAEKNACKKACLKYRTLGLNAIDEIQFKSQVKPGMCWLHYRGVFGNLGFRWHLKRPLAAARYIYV